VTPGDEAPAAGRPASAGARVRVVAAALYDARGRVLIAERPAGKHMAGRWEFPGGKVQPTESDEQALARELHEELGIQLLEAAPLLVTTHDYSDRTVELSMWVVERYRGEPCSLDGQRLRWVRPQELPAEDILEADRPFIEALLRRAAAGVVRGAVTMASRQD
jgi:8-oxo-dGTP diphosphatase